MQRKCGEEKGEGGREERAEDGRSATPRVLSEDGYEAREMTWEESLREDGGERDEQEPTAAEASSTTPTCWYTSSKENIENNNSCTRGKNNEVKAAESLQSCGGLESEAKCLSGLVTGNDTVHITHARRDTPMNGGARVSPCVIRCVFTGLPTFAVSYEARSPQKLKNDSEGTHFYLTGEESVRVRMKKRVKMRVRSKALMSSDSCTALWETSSDGPRHKEVSGGLERRAITFRNIRLHA
ncbi:hypothetical protein EYF80_011253 [Liparis tanakae]|uniref:Uncharacterized protein n=1 Tax=Liparis tanakae TaxID=230148 RepID=A0A4Z2IKD3_9TELE|nr:hypothetical protein EYF80_011253 [Liparis tanakae]